MPLITPRSIFTRHSTGVPFWRILVSILIAVLLGILVSKFLDVEKLIRAIRNVSWAWLCVALAFFLLYLWGRAIRFKFLIDPPKNRWSIFDTVCLQSFLNAVLPFGMGDASLVYMLNRFHGTGYHEGTAAIILTRLVDFFQYMVMLVAASAVFSDMFPPSAPFLFLGFLSLAVTLVIAIRKISVVRKEPALLQISIVEKFRMHFRRLAHAVEDIRRRGVGYRLLVYSTAINLLNFLFISAVVFSLGYNLTWVQAFVLYAVLISAYLLPIRGVANIGTHESACFVVLKLLGYSSDDAATLGFGSHVIMLGLTMFAAVISGLNIVILDLLKKRKTHGGG
jgi:uncharacterized protein (TIRG00374 family)